LGRSQLPGARTGYFDLAPGSLLKVPFGLNPCRWTTGQNRTDPPTDLQQEKGTVGWVSNFRGAAVLRRRYRAVADTTAKGREIRCAGMRSLRWRGPRNGRCDDRLGDVGHARFWRRRSFTPLQSPLSEDNTSSQTSSPCLAHANNTAAHAVGEPRHTKL
jgi:hypothetical protein